MSNSFARWALGTDGFALACQSTGAQESGHIGTIVSCRATSPLWTAYFILDDFLDSDLILARSTWMFIDAMRSKLPVPWTNFVSIALLGTRGSPRLAGGERQACHRSELLQHEGLACGASNLSERTQPRNSPVPSSSPSTSSEPARNNIVSPEWDVASVSSVDSIWDSTTTPGLSRASTIGSVCSVQELESDIEDAYSTSGSLGIPCPATSDRHISFEPFSVTELPSTPRCTEIPSLEYRTGDQFQSNQICPLGFEPERWTWDQDAERFHLSGRSEDDPGYWYPEHFA